MSERETVTFTKQCDCHPATASGPRVVHDSEPTADGRVRVTTHLVRMACDVCDTPWKHDGKLRRVAHTTKQPTTPPAQRGTDEEEGHERGGVGR